MNKQLRSEAAKQLSFLSEISLPSYPLTFLSSFKRSAFTLAETLIVLAIIGVVAALTVPNFVNSYQHRANVNKWRKAYSQFSQIALKMSEDYGVSTFKEVVNENLSKDDVDSGVITNTVIEIFTKYFKDVKSDCNGRCHGRTGWYCNGILVDKYVNNKTGYKYLNGTDAGYWVLGYNPTACFKTPDFVFALDTYRIAEQNGSISVDVNGTKPPNVIGKDIFVLNMSNLLKVLPGGAKGFGAYTSADYACDENAKYGGPACSIKYLTSY